jgi:Ser/Thr protein kinase RdoA (MazF antagonist)
MAVPHLTSEQAQSLAAERFALSGWAKPLPSERDQNFALTTPTGERFVLKIANSEEERATLELQNAALRHAAAVVTQLEMPRIIATADGPDIGITRGPTGERHFIRLLTWLEGEPMARVRSPGEGLLRSLGSGLAELDRALRDFSHPAAHRTLRWDVRHAGAALQHLSLLAPDEQAIVTRLMEGWKTIRWLSLRHQITHGDANDYNVLVREGRVVGLLDFGDMVHTALACDLAIALAYAMLDKPDPIGAARTIIAAYDAILPLTGAERDALFSLTTARLCLSVCYAALNAREKSDDAYQQVTAGPAWRLLRHLVDLPPNAARNAFIGTCESS